MIPEKTLRHGFSIPVLGCGTWRMGGASIRDYGDDGERAVQSLRSALELGFRHIDTAEMYAEGFAEEIVGRAIRGRNRRELFLTGKVWKTHLHYDDVLRACEGSLKRLGTDYLDLYLIHQVNDKVDLAETLRAMGRLVEERLVRFVGVSNFALARLKKAMALAPCPIVANQVHYNIAVREAELQCLPQFCREQDVMLIAWRPLQKGMLAQDDSELLTALAVKYGRSPAQIALNWLLAQPNVVAVTKMSDEKHQQSNLDAIGWTMEEEEYRLLSLQYPRKIDVSPDVPLS